MEEEGRTNWNAGMRQLIPWLPNVHLSQQQRNKLCVCLNIGDLLKGWFALDVWPKAFIRARPLVGAAYEDLGVIIFCAEL